MRKKKKKKKVNFYYYYQQDLNFRSSKKHISIILILIEFKKIWNW